jgi:hypothetical protein
MLFKEIIAVYIKNYMDPINMFWKIVSETT